MDLTNATIDAHGVMTVGTVGDETIQVIPMIYNMRIVVSTDPQTGYDHGWCYPRGGIVFGALMAWDPETQDEPPNYVKRATPGRRTAPRKAIPA